eukprot:TRINITY_DN193_c0_g4_i4.p1 TRINITY_DN193_c0_g4~~TRINITY_DN193_c0_g4_i4.p1  ORF type:complete len:444 (+),score=142.15 TRINITY_DN193_c0_g4_i4:35-1366(+)
MRSSLAPSSALLLSPHGGGAGGGVSASQPSSARAQGMVLEGRSPRSALSTPEMLPSVPVERCYSFSPFLQPRLHHSRHSHRSVSSYSQASVPAVGPSGAPLQHILPVLAAQPSTQSLPISALQQRWLQREAQAQQLAAQRQQEEEQQQQLLQAQQEKERELRRRQHHTIYHSTAEEAAGSLLGSHLERVNLNKRNLAAIPFLKGEPKVRLLNMQYNFICKIENLAHLTDLIFLDLYHNQIKTIGNLDALTHLRVLLLGGNHITRLENLSQNSHLDVLDLHSNNITKLENLSALQQLRTLNLSVNKLQRISGADIRCLASLTELNLRKNSITHVSGLDSLPSLRKVLLSDNCIHSFYDVQCLFSLTTLEELSLDNNAICEAGCYRAFLIDRIKGLKVLDGIKVTEGEAKQTWNWGLCMEKRFVEETCYSQCASPCRFVEIHFAP